jgi:hypothetical protein
MPELSMLRLTLSEQRQPSLASAPGPTPYETGLDTLTDELREARAAVEAQRQAEVARQARRLWERLRDAWRGA